MIEYLIELQHVAKSRDLDINPIEIGLHAYENHKDMFGSFKYVKNGYSTLMGLRYDYCIELANKSIEDRL